MAGKRDRDEAEDAQSASAASAADAEAAVQSSDDDDDVGPMPAPAGEAPRKRRVLEFERLFVSALPCAGMYERSYMHRDVLTRVLVSSTDFVVTCSADGFVKFWKKNKVGIEFVKTYRAHLEAVNWADLSPDGMLLATVGRDKYIKVFDVINFDAINMLKLDYVPGTCCWALRRGEAQALLAVSSAESPDVHIYDARDAQPVALRTFSGHPAPVTAIAFNERFHAVVSADARGMVECWDPDTLELPRGISFESKLDTDLYEFGKNKTYVFSIEFSPKEDQFVCMAADRKVRVFTFSTGKLYRVYDETLAVQSEMQQAGTAFIKLEAMDFGRRLAVERELDKSDIRTTANAVFDESGNFILYATLLGVKVVNIRTNKVVTILGSSESAQRFLNVSLYQGAVRSKVAQTLEMAASDNPNLREAQEADPTLFCTAFKRNRFYMITRREPGDASDDSGVNRDVFNEKPTREEQTLATEAVKKELPTTAVLYTTLGDITIKLFPEFAPLAVENFVTHARNGYYNNHIFHRVIKGFMIQTGDPFGDGTGGTSIWNKEFEDEFHRNLRHDRPYTVSMANAGPNTNGSQFFITTVPTPWLDNKHTIFGRCTAGMEIVHTIERARVNKLDKPFQDIKILNIEVRH